MVFGIINAEIAELILLGVSEGRDRLFTALQKKGAPRFSLAAGENADAVSEQIAAQIRQPE